jgi:hypothetical protein
MSASKFFGNARVGSVIDCLALPGSEQDVVHAVTRILDARGVDIIETHETWCAAFHMMGWMSGSHFIFSSSPKLTERLASMHWLGRIARRDPNLFVLWQLGVRPEAGE